jgi:predicted choloylglycine hydrolase
MTPTAWLGHRLTTLDPEELALQELARIGLSPAQGAVILDRSRARRHQEWTAFLARRLPHDEVWYFESPPATWRELAGVAGYAIVRDGQIVERLVLRRS